MQSRQVPLHPSALLALRRGPGAILGPCKAMDQPPASVGEAAAAADAQPKAESCRANTDTTVGVAQRCQPHRACKAAAPQRSRDKEPALSQLPAEHQEQVQRLPRVARMGKPQGGAKQTHANYGVPEITIEAEAVAGGSVQIPVTVRNGPVRRRQPRRACSAIHPQPAQKGEAKPSTWPGKEAHKAPAASHKRKPDKDKESPVTRRQRMLCAGEQQRYIQAAETEPPTPAHAPQALASQGTGPAQLAQSPDAAPSQQGLPQGDPLVCAHDGHAHCTSSQHVRLCGTWSSTAWQRVLFMRSLVGGLFT